MTERLLRGSIPPLITPFANGEVDFDCFAKLLEHQIEQGSHGVLINGTTAEPSTLTVDERNRLVSLAVETVAGRLPVVAATGSQSLAESRALTEHAVAAGADALLIVTPYYICPPQRGLVEYYAKLTESVEIPWMVYHIPGRTVVGVTIETLAAIRERSPHCIGLKHAANDLGFVSQCMAAFGPEFKVFAGLEELSFPMLAIGAIGLMNAVGNLQPRLLARLCDDVAGGDIVGARKLHDELFEINQAVFFDTNPIPVKYMMKRAGLIDDNEHRLPMAPATGELERRLDAVLERSGISAPA